MSWGNDNAQASASRVPPIRGRGEVSQKDDPGYDRDESYLTIAGVCPTRPRTGFKFFCFWTARSGSSCTREIATSPTTRYRAHRAVDGIWFVDVSILDQTCPMPPQ